MGGKAMRAATLFLALLVFVAVDHPATAHAARVEAKIDLSEQRMRVYKDGKLAYNWPVSTARKGYRTPTGTYRPTRMHVMWHSRKYDMSPMPHSIFFHGGYAIHGTNAIKSLGRPASHGCVRLHPSNAKALFSLVKQAGPSRTRIVITR
jgi:lipoprotein-anchoring transpeptidase ErfK/SrfK